MSRELEIPLDVEIIKQLLLDYDKDFPRHRASDPCPACEAEILLTANGPELARMVLRLTRRIQVLEGTGVLGGFN